jgi:hypothetical protein
MVYKYILTVDELEKWINNVTINPITKRKIKIDGPTYKQFKKQYENYNNDKNKIKITEFIQINKLDLDNKFKMIVYKYIKINIDILSDTKFKKKFLLYHPDSCKRTINYNGKDIIGIGRFIEDKSPFITDNNIIKCATQLFSVVGKKGIVF